MAVIFSGGGYYLKWLLQLAPLSKTLINTDFFCIPYMWSRYDHTNIFLSREKKFCWFKYESMQFFQRCWYYQLFDFSSCGSFLIVNSVLQEKGVKRMTQLVLVLIQIYCFFICEVPVHWHIVYLSCKVYCCPATKKTNSVYS